MLNSAPRLGPRATTHTHCRMRPCNRQYSRDQAIAQARIPKYANARKEREADTNLRSTRGIKS